MNIEQSGQCRLAHNADRSNYMKATLDCRSATQNLIDYESVGGKLLCQDDRIALAGVEPA